MLDFNNGQIKQQNPQFPRRFLRLLSMGCGISKFDPKEVVEVTTNNPPPPPPYQKPTTTTSSNCFTGESKRNLINRQPPNHVYSNASSSDDRAKPDYSSPKEDKIWMNNNVKCGGKDHHSDDNDNDDDENEDINSRDICRGGSPSFREYCIDSDSVSMSMSMRSEDNYGGDSCKWSNEQTPNPEKEKEVENEIGKKERRGKGLRIKLQRGRSGVKKSASHGQQQQNNIPSPNNQVHDSSNKLLAKAS